MPQDILARLVSQLKAKGMDEHKAHAVAISTLKKSGSLDAHAKLTSKGKKRTAMGADDRAKDRASRATGHSASEFVYSSKTNRATLRGKGKR
jgi:hypothetical protein